MVTGGLFEMISYNIGCVNIDLTLICAVSEKQHVAMLQNVNL